MPKPHLFSNAVLREMYVDKRMSLARISKDTGIPGTTLRRRLAQAGVELRGYGDAMDLARARLSPLLTSANVHRIYTVEGNTMEHTAKTLNVAVDTLRRFMKRVGIRRRRSHYTAYAESRYELVVDETELLVDYNVRQLPLAKIARKHGISKITVQRRLARLGAEPRPRGGLRLRAA